MRGHGWRFWPPGQSRERKKQTQEWEAEKKRHEEERQGREDKKETEKWEQGKDPKP
jgi:hypothetical protein